MHLSLGGIVKGIETGLTTLVETGNPYIAAGAGAIACFTDNGSGNSGTAGATNANVPTFNPLLDSLSAESSSEQQHVNALSSFAQQHAADLGSIVDGDISDTPDSIAA
jgi:hypothetical protein